MKLYVLRHYERYKTGTFFVELTPMGKKNSNNTNTIKKLNIDVIYCSPFIRTLQSIEPYCTENNIKVNIENSLYEYLDADYFDLNNYNNSYHNIKNNKENKKILNIINNKYKSLLSIKNIEKPLNYQTYKKDKYHLYIVKRINNFINYLYSKYNKDVNILLVSHKGTINTIKHIIYNNINDIQEKNLHDDYPVGKISILIDNNITCLNL